MEDNETMLKTSFSFTDEFNQTSTLTKNYTEAVLMDTNTLEFLLEEFKYFLKSMGFSSENVDKIQYLNEEGRVKRENF